MYYTGLAPAILYWYSHAYCQRQCIEVCSVDSMRVKCGKIFSPSFSSYLGGLSLLCPILLLLSGFCDCLTEVLIPNS